jgi:hypothetical protein
VQLLLGYLPAERGAWEGVLAQKRAAYAQFVEELIIDPQKEAAASAPCADHPLSQSSDSRWNAFFKARLSAACVGPVVAAVTPSST